MEPSAEFGLESLPNARIAGARVKPGLRARRRQEAALMLVGLLVAELGWLAFLAWVAFRLI